MNTIKEWIMVIVAALAILIMTGVAKADSHDKTTVGDFLSAIASIPGKVVNHVKSEAESIKTYQSENWAEMKQKWPFKQNSSE